MVVYAAMR